MFNCHIPKDYKGAFEHVARCLENVTTWYPRETAVEEEGNRILAWIEDEFRDKVTMYAEVLEYTDLFGWSLAGEFLGVEFTHWMPLPEPPKVEDV